MILNIYIILSSVLIVGMFLFVLFLFFQRHRGLQSRPLFWLALTVLAWLVLDLATSFPTSNQDIDIFIWRLGFASALAVTLVSFRFISVVVSRNISKLENYFTIIFYFIVSIFTLFTNWIISDIRPLQFSGESNYQPGQYFIVIIMAIILPIVLSFIYISVRTFQGDNIRSQSRIIWLGLLFPALLALFVNLILPIIIVNTPKLANVFVFIGVVFFIYSIYKWNAFNIFIRQFKIRAKLIIGFLTVSLIPIVVIIPILYLNTSQQLLDSSLSDERHDILTKKNSIDGFLTNLKSEVLFLSQLSNLQTLVNATDKSELDIARDKLEQDFLAFSKERGIYYQIRYLNETGQEIVRIDYDGYKLTSVDKNNLQNKSGRYYFENTMAMELGDIFISPLDLNIEQGQLENRGSENNPIFVPVIRYATPVFNNNGDAKGVIITNIYADNFLKYLTEINTEVNIKREVFLINSDGYYLSHPDKSREWGFMLKNNETVYNYCDNANEFFIQESGQLYDENIGCYLTFERIYLNSSIFNGQLTYDESLSDQGDDYYWVLISKVEKFIIFSGTKNIIREITAIILFVMFFIIILAVIFSKTISQPIKKLREGVEIIGAGDLNHLVGTDAGDEIGQLSRDFDIMTTAIKQSRIEIDTKVKTQTKEISLNAKNIENQQKAVLNILEDVQEERDKVSQERDKTKTILHSIGDGVMVIDFDYRITVFNKVAVAISGVKAEKAIGKKFNQVLKFVHEETKKPEDGFIYDVIKSGQIQQMPKKTVLIKPDKTIMPVADSAAPLKDSNGQIIGCVVVFRDSSKEREIDKMKSEFVSVASHQLRTPLSAIRWFLEMVIDGDAGKLNKDQTHLLQKAFDSNIRMISLVNDLLNVSRIESGRIGIEPKLTDIVSMITPFIDEITPMTKARNQKINFIKPKNLPKIKIDPKLIGQAFMNLLSNAVKYSLKSGVVEIKVSKKDNDVLISIKDSGMGIPKDQQAKLFTKFFRASNAVAKETEGTGLGLYVVKSIIESSGGKLYFESEEGKGSRFWFTLPLTGSKEVKGEKGLEKIKLGGINK